MMIFLNRDTIRVRRSKDFCGTILGQFSPKILPRVIFGGKVLNALNRYFKPYSEVEAIGSKSCIDSPHSL